MALTDALLFLQSAQIVIICSTAWLLHLCDNIMLFVILDTCLHVHEWLLTFDHHKILVKRITNMHECMRHVSFCRHYLLEHVHKLDSHKACEKNNAAYYLHALSFLCSPLYTSFPWYISSPMCILRKSAGTYIASYNCLQMIFLPW